MTVTAAWLDIVTVNRRWSLALVNTLLTVIWLVWFEVLSTLEFDLHLRRRSHPVWWLMLQTDLNHGFSWVNSWKKLALGEVSVYHSALCVRAELLQPCPTLCNPVDCSPPGFSVHGILQARILEWVAMPSSRGSSWPRDWTHFSCVACIAGKFITAEPPRKPFSLITDSILPTNESESQTLFWTDRHKSVPDEMES